MTVGLDDALLGLLAASANEVLVRRLRSDPARKAMRQVVERAVKATVADNVGHLDGRQAEHLRHVMQEHDTDLSRAKVSSLHDLRVALRSWIAALDLPEFGEPGYLSRLGIDAESLCEQLTEQIAFGIRENGRAGGALGPLGEWLWRDELKADVSEIRRDLSQLRTDLEPRQSPGGGLPGGTPEFTGRQEVLDELTQRVEAHEPAGNVVAIHAVDGMAGVGKTELALRAAHQHKHRYPDGQFFINLHGYTEGIPPMSPQAALEELLWQAGVHARAIPPDMARRQARWQALMARRRALVLLDNARDATQVRPLLPMSASCLVLITSRSRLPGLPGARSLPLDVLPATDSIELFTRLVGAERCREQGAVAAAVRLVGYLPVAVQAVAGQVNDGYSVAELAADLADAKARNNLVDQVSPLGAGVRTAFETSLRRLDRASRRAFRILGLHPGPAIGVPQFAALADMRGADAYSILRQLAERNLIKPTHNRAGHRRYELHDLTREFVRQQANAHLSSERSPAMARLTAWYATALRVVKSRWNAARMEPATGPILDGLRIEGPVEARAWLAAEQSNLVAFAELATGSDAAFVCHEAGWRYYLLDHYATARALFLSAAVIDEQNDNQSGQADALIGLGAPALATGDYGMAAEHFHDALVICRRTEDRSGEANAMIGLGQVARATGDYPDAREYFRHGLAICRQTGDRLGIADALRGLGDIARATGDGPGAGKYYRNALALYRHIQHRRGEANTLRGLGDAARATGDHPSAGEYFRNALALYRSIEDRGGEADALWGIGSAAKAEGRLGEAREWWQTALAIYVETASPRAETVRQELDELGRE